MKKYDVLDIGIIVADIPVKLPCESLDFCSDTFRVEKEAGITVSADVGHDNYSTGFAGVINLLRYVDFFMPSYVEAKYITGEAEPAKMAECIVRHTGEKTVIIKLGAQGCYVHEGAAGYTVPAFPVNIVDTTGAGDNFVAGFIGAYLGGGSVRECARFACAAAAVSTQYLGATSACVTLPRIRQLLQA